MDLEEASGTFSMACPETSFIQKENFRQIEAAINALPPKCKLVFRLIKEEGLRYKEVAELLSVAPKTVEAHMATAYNRIAESLDGLLSEFTEVRRKASS